VAFDVAIQALDSVKRDEADAAVIAEFNNQLQTLQSQASALEATLAVASTSALVAVAKATFVSLT
jgi:BMFP domain-containing protein YqiC